MEKTTEIQIRFSDLDCYGHVNNAVYLSYLEAARVDLIQELFTRDMARGIQYLLIRADLKYIHPIVLTDRVLVRCWFEDVGKVRFKAAYEVHNGEGLVFATGYTEHALFDAEKQRPIRLAEDWKAYVMGDGTVPLPE